MTDGEHMNKDAYKDIFQGWLAKAAEYKMAIGIAVACTIIILVSLVWPRPTPEPTISEIKTTPPASRVFTTPAQAPTPAPAPAAQPATPPPAPAPSPMEKELAAKPLFPPAPKQIAPAPKPQAAPAPKPAATPVTTNTAGTTTGSLPTGWYVQLGSFKDKQKAIALAGKVEDKHWQSRIAPRPGGLHAVWVGPYPTRADAEKAKLALQKDTGLSGFPVQSP
jgi:DedD protein